MANTTNPFDNQDLPPRPEEKDAQLPAEEDIDTQLNAVECQPFTEEEIHQMIQKVQVRILMEKLRERDQAMIDLMEFLSLPGQTSEEMALPSIDYRNLHADPRQSVPWLMAPRMAPRPPEYVAKPRTESSWAGTAKGSRRTGPESKTRKKGWRPNKSLVSLVLGLFILANFIWSQAFQTQATFGKKEARRASESRLITKEIVKAQCLIEGPQLLPVPQRINPKHQAILQNTLVIFLNFIDKNLNDPFLKKDIAETHYWAANLYLHLAQYEKARACFAQGIPLLQELAEEQRSVPLFQRNLAESCLNYGVVLARMEEYDQAERALGKALFQWAKLHEQYPDDRDYKLGLAATHNLIGGLFIETHRPDEAEKAHHQAAGLLQEVMKDLPAHAPQRTWLANHYQNRGKLLVATHQLKKARQEYQKALEILAQLPRDCPNIAEYKNDLATQFNVLGNLFIQNKNIREAKASYAKSREIMLALVAELPAVDKYHTNLGTAFHQFATLALDQGNSQEARQLENQAIGHHEKALALNPKSASAKKALRDSYTILIAAAIQRGDHLEAARACRSLGRLMPDSFEDHKRAVTFLARCVDLGEKDGRIWPICRGPLIHIYAEQLQDLLRKMEKLDPGPYSWENEMAWFLATSPAHRFRNPARAVAMARIAVKNHPHNGVYRNTLGVALYRNAQYREAVDALKESMVLKNDGDICDWFFLAMAYWNLKEENKARAYYAKGLEWMKKNPLDDELRGFYEEVAQMIPRVDSRTFSQQWKNLLKVAIALD